jgi:hypothetical protein
MTKTMSPELAALCTQLEKWRQQGGGGRGKRVPAIPRCRSDFVLPPGLVDAVSMEHPPRSASLGGNHLGPPGLMRPIRSTAFSASRYSVTRRWSRLIQPARVKSRKCSGRLDMDVIAAPSLALRKSVCFHCDLGLAQHGNSARLQHAPPSCHWDRNAIPTLAPSRCTRVW